MSGEQQTVHLPDFVVRQVGALQLQLAAAQEENRILREQLAAKNDLTPDPNE